MVHHRALRATGCARGEDDVGDIGSADRPLERGTAGEELGVQVYDRYAGGRGVILAEETLLYQDGLRCAAGDDVAGFFRFEPSVHRHQHPAGGEQPESRDNPFRRVGCPDRNAFTFANA